MKYTFKGIIEIIYPLVISTAVALILFFTKIYYFLDFEELSTAGIGLFGILIGFFVTTLTILNTLENEYIRALKKAGNFNLLGNYLKVAIWSSLYAIITSVLYLFIFNKIQSNWMEYVELIYMFIFFFALTNSYRFISVFLRLTIK